MYDLIVKNKKYVLTLDGVELGPFVSAYYEGQDDRVLLFHVWNPKAKHPTYRIPQPEATVIWDKLHDESKCLHYSASPMGIQATGGATSSGGMQILGGGTSSGGLRVTSSSPGKS